MISHDRVQIWPKTVFVFGVQFVDFPLSFSVPLSIVIPVLSQSDRGGFAVTIVASPRGHQDLMPTDVFCWNELSDLLAAEDLFAAGGDVAELRNAKREDDDDDAR